jgi:hypothetical protein
MIEGAPTFLSSLVLMKDGDRFRLVNVDTNREVISIDSTQFMVSRFGIKFDVFSKLVQVFRHGSYLASPTE